MSGSRLETVHWSSRIRGDTETPNILSTRYKPDTIFFGSGVPDPAVFPSEAFQTTLDGLLSSSTPRLDYCRGRGDATLRELIAHRASRAGAPTTPDDLVVTAGTSGALTMLAFALLDVDDIVLVEEMTYPGAVAAFRQAGGRVMPVSLDSRGIDTGDLERILATLAVQGDTPKFLYTISNNQSPTATTLAVDRRQPLMELAERFGFLVVQDDTYGEIWYDGEHPGSLRRYDQSHTIHLGSFSKTLAPALRCGWIAAPSEIADVIARSRTDLGTSGLTQALVASLLESGFFDTHLSGVSAFYREKRDLLVAMLKEHVGSFLQCSAPPGGFFVWSTMIPALAPHIEKYAAEEGVAVLMGSFFDQRRDRVAVPGLRLAFCEIDKEKLEAGAARLGAAARRCAEDLGLTIANQ